MREMVKCVLSARHLMGRILLLLSCSVSAQVHIKQSASLDPNVVTINDFKISITEHQVYKVLGRPKKTVRNFNEMETRWGVMLYYPGMIFYYIGNELNSFNCKARFCETDRGIKVGDKRAKVIAKYGSGTKNKRKKINALLYPINQCDCFLIFEFKNNRVVNIKYWVYSV